MLSEQIVRRYEYNIIYHVRYIYNHGYRVTTLFSYHVIKFKEVFVYATLTYYYYNCDNVIYYLYRGAAVVTDRGYPGLYLYRCHRGDTDTGTVTTLCVRGRDR